MIRKNKKYNKKLMSFLESQKGMEMEQKNIEMEQKNMKMISEKFSTAQLLVSRMIEISLNITNETFYYLT